MSEQRKSKALGEFSRSEKKLKEHFRLMCRLLPPEMTEEFEISPPPSLDATRASNLPSPLVPRPSEDQVGVRTERMTSDSSLRTVWSGGDKQVVPSPEQVQ